MDAPDWYGVKCLVEHAGLADALEVHVYEERVVLVRAASFEEAIERAERRTEEYASGIGGQYIGYANAYRMSDVALGDGAEVYSVMREVPMLRGEFISHYYDDGTNKGR